MIESSIIRLAVTHFMKGLKRKTENTAPAKNDNVKALILACTNFDKHANFPTISKFRT